MYIFTAIILITCFVFIVQGLRDWYRKVKIQKTLQQMGTADQSFSKHHLFLFCKEHIEENYITFKKGYEILEYDRMEFSTFQYEKDPDNTVVQAFVVVKGKREKTEEEKNQSFFSSWLNEGIRNKKLFVLLTLRRAEGEWYVSQIEEKEQNSLDIKFESDLSDHQYQFSRILRFYVVHVFSYKPWKEKRANSDFNFDFFEDHINEKKSMRLSGTIVKTFFLLALVVSSASFMLIQYYEYGRDLFWLGILAGMLAFIVIMYTLKNPRFSAITTPIYAVLEGMIIGSVSIYYEENFQGIIIQSVALTFAVVFMMFVIYSFYKPSYNFILGILSMTTAIFLVYVVEALPILPEQYSLVFDDGARGWLFSIVIVVVASLHLLVDFDVIRRGIEIKAARYMEWFSAFSLILTIVWLYAEILKLLGRARNN